MKSLVSELQYIVLTNFVLWLFKQAYYVPQGFLFSTTGLLFFTASLSFTALQMTVFYVAADNIQNFVPMNVLYGRHCQPFLENFYSHICEEGVMWVTPILFYEVNLIKKNKKMNYFARSEEKKGGRCELTKCNAFFAFTLHIFWCQNYLFNLGNNNKFAIVNSFS